MTDNRHSELDETWFGQGFEEEKEETMWHSEEFRAFLQNFSESMEELW